MKEAEAIKLFSNTYLAMRVAFFNELDTFSLSHSIDTRIVIEGVCADERIGNHYNNPSFGFGGYCLPKDTKQLRTDFADLPQHMISAVIHANEVRKDEIVKAVRLRADDKPVGIFRLVMKNGSDNMRESSVVDVWRKLEEAGVATLIYEPLLDLHPIMGADRETDLESFKQRTGLIICNRYSTELADVKHRLFTPDIFHEN